MSVLFFPADRITIKRMVVLGVTDSGEDDVEELTPPGLESIPADVQEYSIDLRAGVVLGYPEDKSGIYYRVNLPFNQYTRTIRERDVVVIVQSDKWANLIGQPLGVERKHGMGNLMPHLELLVRHGHRF